MKINFITIIRRNPILTAIAALVALLGVIVTGGQMVHAGLAGFESGTSISPARGVQPGVPTTKAMVAEWWQWYFRIPVGEHPTESEDNCDQDQSGDVWFLVSGGFDWKCTVPAGIDIMVPIINADCSTLEDDPFFGEDKAALKACVEKFFTDDDELSFKIDGKEVGNPLRFRRQSRLFEITIPDSPDPGNIIGVSTPPNDGQAIGDGYYVIVKNLSVTLEEEEPHIIEFSGTLGPNSFFPGFGFSGSWTITVDDNDDNQE